METEKESDFALGSSCSSGKLQEEEEEVASLHFTLDLPDHLFQLATHS